MMNRRLKYNLALVACVLVFFLSFGSTLANWAVAEDSVGRLTLGIVEGEIRETYTQGQIVSPGQTVEKIVNIENTGNVDSLVRVRLDKAWGAERNPDGTLVPDAGLSPDAIHITCNSEAWYYNEDDGFWYYKGVLEPGEITATALMDSFTVDSSAGNEYSGKCADIHIHLECVQAGGNGISAWGMTLEELGIVYTPDVDEIPSIYVGFVNPDDGFEFDIYEGDLFMNFKELVPGEERSEILEIENSFDEPVEIFVRAQLPDEITDDATKTELVEKLLSEYSVITVLDSDGEIVYSGPVWTDDEGVASMRTNLSLGKYSPQSKREFTIVLDLAPELDNTYRELLGSVKWIFEASGTDEPVPAPTPELPKTGDSKAALCVSICALMFSATLIPILIVKRPKKEENN